MVVAVVRLHPLPFSHHCQEAQSDEPASLRQTEAGAIRTERVNYRCSTLRHVFQIISFTRWRDLLDRHFSALPPSPPPGYSLESLSLSCLYTDRRVQPVQCAALRPAGFFSPQDTVAHLTSTIGPLLTKDSPRTQSTSAQRPQTRRPTSPHLSCPQAHRPEATALGGSC